VEVQDEAQKVKRKMGKAETGGGNVRTSVLDRREGKCVRERTLEQDESVTIVIGMGEPLQNRMRFCYCCHD
jgi:hypothetical protein